MMEAFKIQLLTLLAQERNTEATSLAFEQLSNMSQAKELIQALDKLIRDRWKSPEMLQDVIQHIQNEGETQAIHYTTSNYSLTQVIATKYVEDVIATFSTQLTNLSSWEQEVEALVNRGQKIAAMRVVMDHKAWPLEKIRKYVEELPINPRNIPNTPIKQKLNLPEEEINMLIQQGEKLQAVILVRTHTHWGLKDAKDYVDKLAAKLSSTAVDIDHASLTNQIKELLGNGKKIQAVKLTKDITGWGLKESKDYVDNIEASL